MKHTDTRTNAILPLRRLAYECETQGVRVAVEPVYLEEESAPEHNRFFWSYSITIENGGSSTVQLRSRYWRIIDANGKVIEVRGAGVVGKQPVLKPGETFDYTSGTPLSTATGFMVGTYQMVGEDGRPFTVDIPMFSLDSPHMARQLH